MSLPPTLTTAQLAAELAHQGQTGARGRPVHRCTLWAWSMDTTGPWAGCVARRSAHKLWWSSQRLIDAGLLRESVPA